MAKKDISKILTTGSTKQKLLLVAEDRARHNFTNIKNENKPALSDHEFNAISESFKTSAEIKLWNKWNRYDKNVLTALTNLQGAEMEARINYSNLRGYILVWDAIQNAELLVNSVLHEIKDPQERKRIAKNGTTGVDMLFSKTTPDEEGYIDIQIDFEKDSYKGKSIKDEPTKTKEFSLWYVMNEVKKQATISAIKFISWREALVDYMDETGFNVQTYKDMIQDLTDGVYRPIIGWQKYQSDENYFTRLGHGRIDNLKDKYAITPNVFELEVDINQYNWFKEQYFND